MNERQDTQAWAEEEFGTVARLEKRSCDRLVDLAASLGQRPSGSLPQHFDWVGVRILDLCWRRDAWLGREGDGPLGWQSLWRGYQRLADMLLCIELLTTSDDTPEESFSNLTGYG